MSLFPFYLSKFSLVSLNYLVQSRSYGYTQNMYHMAINDFFPMDYRLD